MRTESVPTFPMRRGWLVWGVLLAALVLGAAAAEPAFAQRRCELDASITGRICSVETCLILQARVKSPDACGDRAVPGSAPISCNKISGCEALEAMRQRWINCGNARDKINAVCFANKDSGHLQASTQAWQNVSNCNVRIAEPKPVGCADPCPWDSASTLSGFADAILAWIASPPLTAQH